MKKETKDVGRISLNKNTRGRRKEGNNRKRAKRRREQRINTKGQKKRRNQYKAKCTVELEGIEKDTLQ